MIAEEKVLHDMKVLLKYAWVEPKDHGAHANGYCLVCVVRKAVYKLYGEAVINDDWRLIESVYKLLAKQVYKGLTVRPTKDNNWVLKSFNDAQQDNSAIVKLIDDTIRELYVKQRTGRASRTKRSKTDETNLNCHNA